MDNDKIRADSREPIETELTSRTYTQTAAHFKSVVLPISAEMIEMWIQDSDASDQAQHAAGVNES